MKLICINASEEYKGLLTIGKIYDGEEDSKWYHSVHNDRCGNKDVYLKCSDELGYLSPWVVFISLENWRQRKINEILE